MSFILLLLLLTITVLVILVLRKNQQKHTQETVDRTAPLPALGDNLVPDFAPLFVEKPVKEPVLKPVPESLAEPAASTPAKAMDNWQLQVKNFRTSQQYDAALAICHEHFPKSQAVAQAAIILRQQIKISQEKNLEFSSLLQALYSLAALADICGNGSSHKAADITQIEVVLQSSNEKYPMLGHEKLKLLNKGDARLLEQVWGKPDGHRHVKEIYSL